MNIITSNKVEHVYLEDYAFGATGRVFHIAENTGILKYNLWQNDIPIVTIPPTVIKKFATGKGNANKETLQEHFITETGIDIKTQLQLTLKQWNPSSDIIDSYYICKYGVSENGKEK
jgi:Holliday junction resolvasome RuvABC endonuclease subunit